MQHPVQHENICNVLGSLGLTCFSNYSHLTVPFQLVIHMERTSQSMRQKRLFSHKELKIVWNHKDWARACNVRVPCWWLTPEALNWVRSVRAWLSHGEDLGLEGKWGRRVPLGVFWSKYNKWIDDSCWGTHGRWVSWLEYYMPPWQELLSHFTPSGSPADRGWIRFPLHLPPRRGISPTQSGVLTGE